MAQGEWEDLKEELVKDTDVASPAGVPGRHRAKMQIVLHFHALRDTDVNDYRTFSFCATSRYEQELSRNPYVIKIWMSYIESKQEASKEVCATWSCVTAFIDGGARGMWAVWQLR